VKRSRIVVGAALAAMIAGGAYVQLADAQRVDPRRPTTLVVGAPGGASPMQRVDARRSGMSKQNLPGGRLSIAWRKTIGLSIDQAALAGSDGTLAVVTTRGDVVFLDDAGEERGHVSIGAGSVGPAVMTSDGTIVFTTSSGEAVGVKRGTGPNPTSRPRFTTRIGGDRNGRAAPLALDDGGVVVASSTDLVVLDAEGNIRARTALPETIAAPLLASGDKVLAIGASGAVFGWTPGREYSRLGSFGAPIDGGAALADATTLVAVIETNHLVELDIARGVRSTRAIAAQGLYLGDRRSSARRSRRARRRRFPTAAPLRSSLHRTSGHSSTRAERSRSRRPTVTSASSPRKARSKRSASRSARAEGARRRASRRSAARASR
jgi:hypothetical protein